MYYTVSITLTLSRMTNGPATPDTVLYSAAQRDNSQRYQFKNWSIQYPSKKKSFFFHNDRTLQFADLPTIGAFIHKITIAKPRQK